MERKWEIFEDGPANPEGERIHVTLSARRNFYLNGKALEALGDPDAVLLMYDRRYQTIGVSRTSIDKRGAYRLKPKERGRSGGRMLYAANFCRAFGVRPDETLSFFDASVDKDGVLVLDMHSVKPVKAAPRKRR